MNQHRDKSSLISSPLVLGHIVNDMSSYSLYGALPALTALFGLSFLLASLVAMIFSLTQSIIQPLLGRWFDRSRASWLLEAGLIVNCIGIGLIGLAPSLPVLLILVGAAGLGSAAFHPPAFSAVAQSSVYSRGRAMSIFISGGNVGVFLGPILAGLLTSAFGLVGMLWLLPIGFVIGILLFKIRRQWQTSAPSYAIKRQPTNKRLLSILAGITALRSVAIQSAVTFLPLYLVARGNSLLLATTIASLWLAVGVVGQVGGGLLSDRAGRRRVIASSLLLGAATFYGFLVASWPVSLVFLAVSGACLYAGWSVIVTMSSEAAPGNIGAVSGLMLGLSVGLGGLGGLGFGAIADSFGLLSAFNLVIAFALAGGLLALTLPKTTTGLK